jgi:hypothetical protein
MRELVRRYAAPLVSVAGVVGAVLLLVWAGRTTTTRPELAAVVAIVVLVLGLTLVEPAMVPLLSLPLMLLVSRVGAGGVDLSVSDFALGIAMWPALFLAKRPYTAEMRVLLWLAGIYQVATLFTVVNNPYTANIVEWFHAGVLVIGGLLVGWIVGRHGHARLGLRLLLGTITVLAVVTIVEGAIQFAGGDFNPVYVTWPFDMHKNFVGTVTGLGAGIAYARPAWLEWRRGVLITLFFLNSAAVLLTQSRQALIGLVAAIVVLVLRGRGEHKRSKVVLLLAAPALFFVTRLVQDQVKSGNEFNSVFQRLTWFEDSFEVWMTDPWFGVGLRWWYTERFPVQFQPPNAEIEVLTSTGVVGLAAFVALMAGALVVLWRLDPAYGTLALTVLVNRLVQSQFDLYWSAVQASLPFVIIGIALGAQGLALSEQGPRDRLRAAGELVHR